MEVSIIIVTWNTKAILRNCLKSVCDETVGMNYEIIVIDNNSTDDTVEMVKAEFPSVKLIENKHNVGFAAANNQGIAIAKGKYILLLNSDTLILENAIEKTIAFADNHPDAAVIGPRVLNHDLTLQKSCFMFPSLLNLFLSSTYLYKIFPKNRFFGRELMTWWEGNDLREVDVIAGCFMLVRKEAIDSVGIMDESYFMYAEETDWCYRFKKNGWKIIYTPDAKIIHYGGQSTAKVPVKMLVQLRCSILKFIKKHNNIITYYFAKILTILFFILRLPMWFVVYLFCPNSRKEAIIKMRAYLNGTFCILFDNIN